MIYEVCDNPLLGYLSVYCLRHLIPVMSLMTGRQSRRCFGASERCNGQCTNMWSEERDVPLLHQASGN
jgi:hypothetical protein